MKSQQTRIQQEAQTHSLVKRIVLSLSITVAALSLQGFNTLLTPVSAYAASAKMWLPAEPADARVGQVYFNTTNKREYIYNGQEWVPHDASIDTYVHKKGNITPTPAASPADIGGSSKPTTSTPAINRGAAQ